MKASIGITVLGIMVAVIALQVQIQRLERRIDALTYRGMTITGPLDATLPTVTHCPPDCGRPR